MTIDVGRVAMIPVEWIKIGERARQEMGDITGLEDSMKKRGLIQPLALKDRENPDEPYLLLGGERRLAVLIKNKVHDVPARIYPTNISELEIKSIELAENFYRKDFEWQEYDDLVRRIHELQQTIHGKKLSTAADATGWGMKETAEMMGVTKTEVSVAIKRAEARQAFPEIFEKCKTRRDADKIINKLEESVIKEAIAKRIMSQSSDFTNSKLVSGFILKNFFEGVTSVPDQSIHLVEIDPPYGINLPDQKKKDGPGQYILENYNEISDAKYRPFIADTLRECYRVMTDHSWLILWFAPEPWFNDIYEMLISIGFNTTRMCGVWTKGGSGQNMNPSTQLANSYEMFFYAWKGQPALNKAGRGNEFNFSPVPPSQKIHPTEKPIELMREIYNTFAFSGSRLMIPFLGSGNGLIAAYQLGISAFGYELSTAYRDSFLVRTYDTKTLLKI